MSVRLLCCLSVLVCIASVAAAAPGTVSLPLSAVQYRARGQAALQKHLPRKAVGFFSLALLKNPRDTVSLRGRAQAYEAAGDATSAQADYARILSINPADADVLLVRGREREAEGDTAGALIDYRAAILNQPDNIDAIGARAALYRTLGDFDHAAADDDAMMALRPGTQSLLQRARDRQAAGRWTDAADDYKTAAGLSTSPEAWVGLGRCLLHQGKFADAQAATQEALSRAPDRADILLQSGLLYALTGQQSEALTPWDKGLAGADAPTRADAALLLAQALRARQDDPNLLILLHHLEAAPHP